MIETGFDKRVKIQDIVQNQIPEFLLSESPKASEFLKQYYISQEYQGGPIDISENLDQYLKIDNLKSEIISGTTTLRGDVNTSSNSIVVDSTKGFPPQYGLLKIDNEIITYTGLTTNTFTGCIRGFSGITSYHQVNNPNELVFSTSVAGVHTSGSSVKNLSALFLQEFYKKLKYTFTPGLENVNFTPNLDVSNFIKEANSLYQSKGTEESYKILFKVLYNEKVNIIDLENLLLKPSNAIFSRRKIVVAERLSGDPTRLSGQTIRKSTDANTQASVSEVEILTRKGKTYYKLSLFVGNNDTDFITGNFNIPGNTRVIEPVSIGSSIITVDSTIGFGKTGVLIENTNRIFYTDKSVNQFFGCSGINKQISIASTIRSDETVYGYEDGDLNKKVELRITGVLSKFNPTGELLYINEGEIIGVKNIGEKIKNPQFNKTFKQIFANSWIYNTSSRFQVSSISGSTFKLLNEIDKSSLKVGDNVDILRRGTQIVDVENATISIINSNTKEITLDNLGKFEPESFEYDLRRKIVKSSSSGAPLQFGNNKIFANVQNIYVNEETGYVASNSLPEYNITKNILDASIDEATANTFSGLDATTQKYSIILFEKNVPFIDGDEIVYFPEKIAIPGLVAGNLYYVQVLNPKNCIRLYPSRSFIGTSSYIQFDTLSPNTGSHRFVLSKHKSSVINPQKLLKKFSLKPNIDKGNGEKTLPGGVGLLINGVEIVSPKSTDRIFYGPLSSIRILNNGSGYDVINPPVIDVSNSSDGSKALVKPVIDGSVKTILVDPQDFDIDNVISVTISGGNGDGAILKPIISKRYRELEFDARQPIFGGGVNNVDETITFTSKHNLLNGQTIIYSNNGNLSLGIGTFGPPNPSSPAETFLNSQHNKIGNKTLSNGSEYVVKIVNSTTVQLYPTFTDYFSGINTIGFTTENATGVHKFRTLEKKTLRDIKVLNSGSGYQNRELYIKPTGISTTNSIINFNNHGFSGGDKVVYSTAVGVGTTIPVSILGLSTSNQYYIIKLNNDSFRLADAGIGATIKENYDNKKYVRFLSTGSGYQIFKYPNIELTINVSYGSSIVGIISATPIVRGKIVDAYLYETGSGYGSTILNFSKNPIITIKNGKNAEVKPFIKDGKIQKVSVLTGGSEYYSIPDLEIVGDGTGAKLRPVIQNQQLIDVIVINSGINYTQNKTTIRVIPAGKGVVLDSNIRSLTLNDGFRFKNEILVETQNNLQYSIVGYSTSLLLDSNINDGGSTHSPIIGWSYDGYPIYGPYGYSDPEKDSSPKLLQSGYVLNTSAVENRPSTTVCPPGFFVEDYKFVGSGDLDIHNGRFCMTPEFPKGTYAYFSGIFEDPETNKLTSYYPYFIGESYRGIVDKDNFIINQDFNLNESDLSRNTFPYNVDEEYVNNDFLLESNELFDNQQLVVKSISKGSVDSIVINNPGDGYKIGENLIFNDEDTNGSGLSVEVSEIEGKKINNIITEIETYPNSVLVWKDNNTVVVDTLKSHNIIDKDYVLISGISTTLSKLSKIHQVGVSTDNITLFSTMNSVASPETVEDIYVSRISPTISIGSTIKIENEILSVLNIYDEGSILRVKRSNTGTAHTISSIVYIEPKKFEIPIQTSYFDSQFNTKVYFNPRQSVGVGSTSGQSSTISHTVGGISKEISVLNQSIYLPNHPFKTGQQVIFQKPSTGSVLNCLDNATSVPFFIPFSGNLQTLYIINKSKDYIGLTTSVGLTTNTSGIYFLDNGSNNYEYSISSNYDQITANIQKNKTIISVSTAHSMKNGDIITLKSLPNVSCGIGTSTSVKIIYNPSFDSILINPIGFNSTGINTSNSQINLDAQYLKTGDKIFYQSTDVNASGLSTGFYFIYKIDKNTIKLVDSYYDTTVKSPPFINIVGAGGSGHQISLVNPQIPVIRNCDLVFNTSDPSLVGKKLKIFYDKNFNNEFISVGNTSLFNVVASGTVGVASTSTLTLKYSPEIPTKLYYALETSGYISTSDVEVKNASEISFVNSAYNGTYSISGVGETSFSITLRENPERSSLVPSDHDTLEYSTSSPTSSGGIKKLNILFGGYGYKKLPEFIGFSSSSGVNAVLSLQSSTIGKVNQTTFINAGAEYYSDKTLKPEANISPIINLSNSNTITKVNVLNGGKNYITPPNLIIVNPDTNTVVESGYLSAKITSNSISSVVIDVPPYGLSSTKQKILSIDNSNGVSISSITSSPSGIVTCVLSTPVVSGFSTSVFSVGEKIFVENIEKISSEGTGFNSKDYGYKFFTVTAYRNTNPAEVEFNLSGLTNNPGIANTNPNGYATIISEKNYPVFEVIQNHSPFIDEEQLLVKNGGDFIERDLFVLEDNKVYIKTKGKYLLSDKQIIKGKISGSVATVNSIIENRGKYSVDYATDQNYGWVTQSGKLNDSSQVIPDNDYYQNLSYSIKSTIQYKDLINPVNRLLHTSGLKNFADTQINSKSKKVSYASTTNDILILDILDEKRVDAVNNFDLVIDVDTIENQSKSKFLKLKNKRLTDSIQCISNKVLTIDNFDNAFSNNENRTDKFVQIDEINETYCKYLIQIINPNNRNTQIYEIISLKTDDDIFSLEKGSLSNTDTSLGEIQANSDNSSFNFFPTNPFDDDYDIKILRSSFNTLTSQIGTKSIGFIDLVGLNTIVGVASTANILSFNSNKIKGFYANIQVVNTITNEMNYVELFTNHDEDNTYQSEFYFDNIDSTESSSNLLGSFESLIDPNSGIVSLTYSNTKTNPISIKAKVVGFGTTSVGVGTYRFLSLGQPEGSENSARYESTYKVSIGETSIIGIDTNKTSSIKSIVRVSYGKTSALHQVLMLQDKKNVYTVQYPFLSVGSTTGIGTFGGSFVDSIAQLNFYPDPSLNSTNIQIQSFNEILDYENDYLNIPLNLEYGTSVESVKLSAYDALNGSRANKLEFDATYKGTPIYSKKFNPSLPTVLNTETGSFKIKNHFFTTGEELIYKPGSTFVGFSASSVGIGSTENYAGISTDILPSRVWVIKENDDEFKLSTKKEYANAGIYVTFTSTGSGNAHVLEMYKKLEKTIISINGVVQSPITFVPVSYIVQNNGGQISNSSTYFSISGISTIKPNDLIKIDNEYMKIISVGIGTTSNGPISGVGSFPLVEVKRGFVGSSSTSHVDGSTVQLYRGSFNISESKIYFTEAPKGNPTVIKNQSNLPSNKASFNGRVYLRSDYTSNIIFDDISDQFTGIGQTYRLTFQGINTTGIQTGNGILLLNNIFQTPSTSNNQGNNYSFTEVSGITSVVFTGINSSNGQQIIADFDVNQNQLPRGGLIVSIGSTPGLGFAPLIGAKLKAIVGSGGTITNITGVAYTGTGKNVSTAYYNNNTGIVEITTEVPHELQGGDLIKLIGLGFTCLSSSGVTSYFPLSGLSGSYGVSGIASEKTFSAFVGYSTLPHIYVGMGTIFPWYNLNYGSGYRNPVSIAITDSNHTGSGAIISTVVGAGGSLSFTITNGGTGYSTSTVMVNAPMPSYENLPVIGVSRLGIGSTTQTGSNLLLTLEVGSASTTGIGSTLFEVSSFKISRPGYGFKKGDVFKPVGLVTARGLSEPISPFEITVLETFTDSISSWQFGELDYIDSIKNLQNGVRKRFPLYYNDELLSFERGNNVDIDLSSVLLIFVNGVVQVPDESYQFEGGTSFTFSEAPKPEDNISIYFYHGVKGVDTEEKNVIPTIKIGDSVQVHKNINYPNTIEQKFRRIDNISFSDIVETNIYTDLGIDEINNKPLTWVKQKRDQIVNGDYVSKARDSIESQVYPTAKIIKDLTTTSNEIFVDDATFFNYEEYTAPTETISSVSGLIVQGNNPIGASATSTISIGGTISNITIGNSGSGYVSTPSIKISPPKRIGIGIGTTATATVSIIDGFVNSVTIVNPGFGYTIEPQVIISYPSFKTEKISNINTVQGFSGIITGITTTSGTSGNPLALKFFLNANNFTELNIGYPIYVKNTTVGSGLTSINLSNSEKVGIGTTFLDNIYIVHNITDFGTFAEIVTNISSDSNIVGIATTGTQPLGVFSWGRLSGIVRSSSPISIGVSNLIVDDQLSSFPTIQRRGFGLRDTGAIRKEP